MLKKDERYVIEITFGGSFSPCRDPTTDEAENIFQFHSILHQQNHLYTHPIRDDA